MTKFSGLDKLKQKLQQVAEKSEWLEKAKNLLNPEGATISSMSKEVGINDTKNALDQQLHQIGNVIDALIAMHEQQAETLSELKQTVLSLKKEFIQLLAANTQHGNIDEDDLN